MEGERQPLLGRARSGSLGLPISCRRGSAARPRRRTDSVTIFAEEEDGEHVTATSYGPVLLASKQRAGGSWALGWFLAIISGVLFTTNNFFVKFLEIDAVEVLLMRSGLQAGVLGVLLVRPGGAGLLPAGGATRALVGLQGLCSGARVLLQLACLAHLPLGDALTLIFTEPLWTLLAARAVLGTRVGPWKAAFSLLLLTGMLLCIQPPCIFGGRQEAEPTQPPAAEGQASTYSLGAVLALGSAITGAAANVIIARCDQVSSTTMVFHSGVGGVVLALLTGLSDPHWSGFAIGSISSSQWVVLVVLGLAGVTGYFALTRSLQLVPPTTVAVLRAMEIILAYLVQALVMAEVPGLLACSGSSLVVLSVLAFALEDIVMPSSI